MRVFSFADVEPDRWDALVDGSPDAWLFHRAAWVGIEASFFTAGNHSFAVEDDRGEPAVVCPLYRRDLGRGGWVERLLDSGHHRQAGPAFRAGLAAPVRRAAIKVAMRHLLDEAARLDVDRVLLGAHNLAPALEQGREAELPFWVRDYGFQLGQFIGPNGDLSAPGLATPAADQIVELDGPEDAVFQRLDENFRKAVRKAVKGGLTCTARTGDPVPDYYALAELSARRTGERLAPREYYQRIWDAFTDSGRCAVLFAVHGDRQVGALFLLLDKGGAQFLGGVSDPEYLPLRVNNLLHWEALRWLIARGQRRYRLGPVFPSLPADWPVSRVARFKGEFGATSHTLVQASLFLKPERYLEDARAAVALCCHPRVAAPVSVVVDREGFDVILRRYGFFGVGGVQGDAGGAPRLTAWRFAHTEETGATSPVLLQAGDGRTPAADALDVWVESGRQLLWDRQPRRWLTGRRPAFHALLPFLSFSGPGLRPVWTTADGRAVLAWREHDGARQLLIGIPVVEEVVRHTQGDPRQAEVATTKACWGFPHERPNYLFEGQLHPDYPTMPWADSLGFTLAELLAELTGLPLVEPLPGGAAGAVLLTGDDDQAWLEKYEHQLRCVGDFPITYFLLPWTRHTPATLAKLRPTVELGLHVDSLDAPERYAERCAEQSRAVRDLCGRPVRSVRNHGFLSEGVSGHLPAWEEAGLTLDVNLPGLDGTALSGSFLPFRVRRPDGSWSSHRTLLTAFGDGMLPICKLSQRQAVRKIRTLARQVGNTRPGALVFNFHPQNISDTERLHRAVVALGRRKGWVALGVESYLSWLEARDEVRLCRSRDGAMEVVVPRPVAGLVVRRWSPQGWRRSALPARDGLRAVA
jgi:hypothetical protein